MNFDSYIRVTVCVSAKERISVAAGFEPCTNGRRVNPNKHFFKSTTNSCIHFIFELYNNDALVNTNH